MMEDIFKKESSNINAVLIQSFSREILNSISSLNIEAVILDMQHGFWSLGELELFMTRCGVNSNNNIVPLVRTPIQPSISTIGSILDSGAWGIIIPFVENIIELKNIKKWVYYPPYGIRSLSRSSGLINTGLNLKEYIEWSAQNISVIAIVETPKGLENLKEILKEADGVLFGIRDLCLITGKNQVVLLEEIKAILKGIPNFKKRKIGYMGLDRAYVRESHSTFNIMGSIRDILIDSINISVNKLKGMNNDDN